MMVDRINDISWQAHQGSVAAIIQVLNDRLADSGIRTRAVFADGVLQLLCEIRTADKLEKSSIIRQIRQILEAIAPRNVHRINVNCRIVREEQLLWLEEIHRENQLLWSEEITLAKPNIFQQFIQDFNESKTEPLKPSLSQSRSSLPLVIVNRSQPQNKASQPILWIVSFLIFFLGVGGAVYIFLDSQVETSKFLILKNNNQAKSGADSLGSNSEDFFADAVRIANEASLTGKTAKKSTQWLQIAASWQRASDLMGKVPVSHSRYQEAQIRTKLYRQYSEAAQKQAENIK